MQSTQPLPVQPSSVPVQPLPPAQSSPSSVPGHHLSSVPVQSPATSLVQSQYSPVPPAQFSPRPLAQSSHSSVPMPLAQFSPLPPAQLSPSSVFCQQLSPVPLQSPATSSVQSQYSPSLMHPTTSSSTHRRSSPNYSPVRYAPVPGCIPFLPSPQPVPSQIVSPSPVTSSASPGSYALAQNHILNDVHRNPSRSQCSRVPIALSDASSPQAGLGRVWR